MKFSKPPGKPGAFLLVRHEINKISDFELALISRLYFILSQKILNLFKPKYNILTFNDYN